MRTFSVAEIMSVRDMYKEPPYPGFSLDEVLRKRATRGSSALQRGENAWRVASAKTSDEGIVRIVQGALNKLAPEKYQEVIDNLTVPSLIATDRAMQLVIDLIFKKALQEPGYSVMYARLCYDMAMYEIQLQAASPSAAGAASLNTPLSSDGQTNQKKSSKFRENIIRNAQKEFQLTDPAQFATLEGEELEEARASLIKRKKANITFVGQLYIHSLLSPSIMFQIMQQVLKTGELKATPPQEVDIEVLNALLETVGKSLDREPHKDKLDLHFERLKQLQANGAYGMRIKFKIMNLLDLRSNQWEPRVMRADNQAPTTLQEQQAKQSATGTSSGPAPGPTRVLGPRSPTTCTPNSRRSGMQRFPSTSQFPDSPQPPIPPQTAWRNVSAPNRETPACTPADFANRAAASNSNKDLPFEARVKALLKEWVNERSNEPIANWRSRFKQGEFGDDDELCQAVVSEVVREACITTKKEAQHEACSFLRVALGLQPDDSPISLGLADALIKGLEEGIKEDVPKFYERFVNILHMVTEKETIVELYCDAAKLLYVAYEHVRAIDGFDAIPELLEVWQLLPAPGDAGEPLPDAAVNFIVDLRDADQEDLAGTLVISLLDTGLVTQAAIETWLTSTSAAQAPSVVSKVREHLAKQ